MGSEDIDILCASLSLLERDGPVRILSADLKSEAMLRLSSSLVGKVLSKKLVNREVFMRVIGRIWQVKKGVEIESLIGNIFSFHFADKEDRCKVLSGAPWTFDNALLVLEEPEEKGTVEQMAFNHSDFWVQIYQVPLLCATRAISWFLGEMIGEVIEVDGGMAGDGVGKFMRVRVRINIDNPFQRCLRVDVLGDGMETVMLLKYERLLNLCFKCGRIGHNTNECLLLDQVPVVNGVEKPLFGVWMKASGSLRKNFYREQRGAPTHVGFSKNTTVSKGYSGKKMMAGSESVIVQNIEKGGGVTVL
ncbi:hypothetical protein Q3G72_009090 [Acer saccharum]|nr:hypothetical protein Q3G72_009090 [Acer saccharum]